MQTLIPICVAVVDHLVVQLKAIHWNKQREKNNRMRENLYNIIYDASKICCEKKTHTQHTAHEQMKSNSDYWQWFIAFASLITNVRGNESKLNWYVCMCQKEFLFHHTILFIDHSTSNKSVCCQWMHSKKVIPIE